VCADEQSHSNVSWDIAGSYVFEEQARRSFDAVPLEDGTDLIRWTCPRCEHPHQQILQRDTAVTALAAGEHKRTGELPMFCVCPRPHASRPEGEIGCGFRLVLTVGEEQP
jgi:hypothetical protein